MCKSLDGVTVNRVVLGDSNDQHSNPDAVHDLKGDSGQDTLLDCDSFSQYIK